MKQAMKANILTLFLAGSVLCYHIASCSNPSAFNLRAKTKTSFIQLRIGDWISGKVDFHSLGNLNFGESSDYASTKIKEYGYALRFLIHQFPGFAIVGKKEKYRRFYLREEICASYKEMQERARQSGVRIAKLISKMKDRGVTMIVVPVPTKISIERSSLPATLPSCGLWEVFATDKASLEENSYENYKAIVDEDLAHIIDLYGIYEKYLKAHPEDYIYVPSDTHWSSLGISLAAKGILDRLKSLGWPIEASSIQKLESSKPAVGDFIHYFQIPPFYIQRSKDLRWIEPLYSLSADAKPTSGRAFIFGTSYSERLRTSGFSLGNLLSKSLKKNVIDLSYLAAGALGSFTEFKQRGYKLKRGDLLVWEFPTRHTLSDHDAMPELDFEEDAAAQRLQPR